MRGMLAILFFTILTMLCWGGYGPVIQRGRTAMDDGTGLRPFICVGLAYFVIAVLVPVITLKIFGEKGQWTATGLFWSLVAGAAGALGALGIILAFVFHGSPVYVMPLVFGGAPVINTFLTMYMSRASGSISPMFIAGLILVVAGAATVLIYRPAHGHGGAALDWRDLGFVAAATLLTVVSWGSYGPTLHKGQAAMAGSRLRPLICVGISYFVIAVIIPLLLLGLLETSGDAGEFNVPGTLWSLAGGATGAIGALGIIMAFNAGGKPIYVMPLVFGGAPVINTFVTMYPTGGWSEANSLFYAGLIVVIAGAVTVLIFAPRPGKMKSGGDLGAHQTPEPAKA